MTRIPDDRLAARVEELEAYERVYVAAAMMRTFPVPFEQHWNLVGAVDEARNIVENITTATTGDSHE